MNLRLDFETRCLLDLKEVGLYNYAMHESTEVLCYAFQIDDQPPVGVMGGELHPDLEDALLMGATCNAWNASFEHAIWNFVCTKRYGWPEMPVERFRDTMAWAAAMNLPQSLGKCAIALGLPQDQQKDKRGSYLIQRLCKPHKATKTRAYGFIEDAGLLKEMFDYCVQDVVTEGALAAILRPLKDEEQKVWEFTLRMNLRGVPVAVGECIVIHNQVEQEKERLNAEAMKITGGISVSKAAQLARWLTDNGVSTTSVAAEMVEHFLGQDWVPPHARRVLEIRQTVCQTSTTKFAKIVDIASDDGTVKGVYTYHGAATGRWASRGGLNMQNLARPLMDDVATCNDILGMGDYEFSRMFYGDQLMDAAVSAVRGVIKAPDDHEFLDADFSSVENRFAAWIAGQHDKLAMFAAGLDEYKTFGSKRLFKVPYAEVTKAQRQLCKPVILGCFQRDTLVLTGFGWKPIVEVTPLDLLWDGDEWVRCDGVAYRGDKEVIDMAGVGVTPDHLIWTTQGWGCARVVAGDLKSALGLANGSWLGTRSIHTRRSGQRRGYVSALADAGRSFLSRIFATESRASAIDVAAKPQPLWQKSGPPTHTCQSKGPCETGGSIESARSLDAVTTPGSDITPATAGAASRSGMAGSTIAQQCWNTSCPSQDGTTRLWSWIESITTAITRPATFAWRLVPSKTETSALQSGSSTKKPGTARWTSGGYSLLSIGRAARFYAKFMLGGLRKRLSRAKRTVVVPTFDVLNAGPRNRFTVLTGRGPVVVHNCMFGLGWKGLNDYAKAYGAEFTEEEAQQAVANYREEYDRVVKCWWDCGDAALAAVRNPGTIVSVNPKLRFKVFTQGSRSWLAMELPSKRLIWWYQPRIANKRMPWGKKKDVLTVEGIETKTRQWMRHDLIPSSLFQSAVQGGARDLLAHGALNLEAAGFDIRLLTHDEATALVRKGTRDGDEFTRILCTTPSWAHDLPLVGEWWRAERFQK